VTASSKSATAATLGSLTPSNLLCCFTVWRCIQVLVRTFVPLRHWRAFLLNCVGRARWHNNHDNPFWRADSWIHRTVAPSSKHIAQVWWLRNLWFWLYPNPQLRYHKVAVCWWSKPLLYLCFMLLAEFPVWQGRLMPRAKPTSAERLSAVDSPLRCQLIVSSPLCVTNTLAECLECFVSLVGLPQ